MTTIPTVAPATTSTGAPLPVVALPQTELLTLNANDLPIARDVLGEGAHARVLRIDVEHGEYVVILILEPGVRIPAHYHTGTVSAWTISGCWHYVEYADQPQTAGSYLYEPCASVHTLEAPESNTEDTVVLFEVSGANVNFSDDGQFHSILDAASISHLIGQLAVTQKLGPVPYISGGAAITVNGQV